MSRWDEDTPLNQKMPSDLVLPPYVRYLESQKTALDSSLLHLLDSFKSGDAYRQFVINNYQQAKDNLDTIINEELQRENTIHAQRKALYERTAND